jgi:hypothetical protein
MPNPTVSSAQSVSTARSALPLLSVLPVLPVLIVLSACGAADPSTGVIATTDKAAYTTAEPVVVTLTNTTSSAVEYSSCPERWDHLADTGYVRFEKLQSCFVGSVPLPAGETVTLTYSFPEGQPDGTWRIPVPLTNADREPIGEARTGDFEVDE